MLRYILLGSIALVIGGCTAQSPVKAAEKKPDTTDIWLKKGQKERQALMRTVLRSWTKRHPEITKNDRPTEVKFVDIWDQHFEGGYIAYSAIEDQVIIFENSPKTFRRVSKSAILIDHARPGEAINWDFVSSLLKNLDEPTKQKYKDLIRRQGYEEGIIGGIGTVYLRERLLDPLKKPIRKQDLIHDVLYAKGNGYEVFVGLRNSPGEELTPTAPRAVYLLRPNGSFDKQTEFPGTYEAGGFLEFYQQQWEKSFLQTLTAHVSLILILWCFLSVGFARTFANLPVLRFPLDLDAYIRKERSGLVKLYLQQVRTDIEGSLARAQVNLVPLPLRVKRNQKEVITLRTDEWCRQFVGKIAKAGHHRVAIIGRGGSGKTVIIQNLLLLLIDKGYVPTFLQAIDYAGETAMDTWVAKILNAARIPLTQTLWLSLPNLILLIDQASEVSWKLESNFLQLLGGQFSTGIPQLRMVVSGRYIGPATSGMSETLQWDEVVTPDELQDEDIKRLGMAYLDPKGESTEIQELPGKIRAIMKDPTAFIVSHYARTRKTSVRSVEDEDQLFQEILDAHVLVSRYVMRPLVVGLILIGLVKKNFVDQRVRGLPAERELIPQVREVIEELKVKENFGEGFVPDPAGFVDRLLASGLVYRTHTRYLFFHDAFEDWLAGEAEKQFGILPYSGPDEARPD